MRVNDNILPRVIPFALLVCVMAFSVLFVREFTTWAILFFLAPFALLQVFAVWLFVSDLSRK